MIEFKNKSLQASFEKNGFAVLNLLDNQAIELLIERYKDLETLHNNKDPYLFSTLDNENLNLSKNVETIIQDVCLPKINQELRHFDYLFSTYLIKKTSQNNPTPFHQDPTLVDNKESISANIWIALEDTAINKGSLRFIPGSHRIIDSLVVTPDFYTYYHTFQHKLKHYCVDIQLKKGQAVIFNNKLVHGAYANNSGKDRIAAVVAVKSTSSPWCYHYLANKEKEGLVEKYYLNKDFYSTIKKNERPQSFLKKESFNFQFPSISYREFQLFMIKNYPKLAFKALVKSLFK